MTEQESSSFALAARTSIERVMSIDVLARQFHQEQRQLAAAGNDLGRAILLANGIRALRGMFTDEVMDDLMALKNTPLGYLTDEATRKSGAYQLKS